MEIKPEDIVRKLQKDAVDLKQALERTIPIKIGATAVEHFKENFQQEGFVNNGLKKWQKRKHEKTTDREVLTVSSDLGSSIDYRTENGKVIVESDLPYAEVHNEGLRSGRGKGFTMPKRQFIGESKELTEKIENVIKQELDKILKP